MNLALKYRPREFKDVVGQRAPSAILSVMIQKKRLASALLFAGPSGVGKTSMARIVAAELNPDAKDAVHAGTHPNVLEIDGASNGSVEAIRTLKKDLTYSSIGHRVIIIDEVHAISGHAFDALLNLLEFTPKNVTFILCTTEEHNIEDAVRHRCDPYTFVKASVSDILTRLQDIVALEQINVSAELLEVLAVRSEGSFRKSQMLLDQVWGAGISSLETYNQLYGDIDFAPSLIASTLQGPSSALNKLETILYYTNPEEIVNDCVQTLRDLILLKSSIEPKIASGVLPVRKKLAKAFNTEELVKAMTVFWDLQTKLSNTDQVRGLEMVFAMLGQLFNRTIINTIPQDETLSLEDLQRLTEQM